MKPYNHVQNICIKDRYWANNLHHVSEAKNISTASRQKELGMKLGFGFYV